MFDLQQIKLHENKKRNNKTLAGGSFTAGTTTAAKVVRANGSV
jgi:hypothetical protein